MWLDSCLPAGFSQGNPLWFASSLFIYGKEVKVNSLSLALFSIDGAYMFHTQAVVCHNEKQGMYRPIIKPFYKIISHFGKKIEKNRFTESPIYIGGCARSGTTLLLSILSAHPDIFACPIELRMFDEVIVDENGKVIPKRKDRLYRTLLTNKIKKSSVRWCEKSPKNVNHIQDIDSYHNGNFKFIHIVRDGRDVILSKHPSDLDRYWVNPERWVNDVKAGLKEYKNPKVHTVKYEKLNLDFENEIRKICAFLNIKIVDEILNWHNHAQVKKSKNYFFGEVKPIFNTSIAKWKKPENKERVQQLLKYKEAKELLLFFGYEI